VVGAETAPLMRYSLSLPGEGCGRESQGERRLPSKRPPKVKGSCNR
jgi:hypothetical protein